jgi:predicted transcriptional regulator
MISSTLSSPEKNFRNGNVKSRLERYLDILKVLAYKGPAKLGLIMQQTDFSCTIALENLGFLVKLNLVKEETDKCELVYSITIQGEKVVRFFA